MNRGSQSASAGAAAARVAVTASRPTTSAPFSRGSTPRSRRVGGRRRGRVGVTTTIKSGEWFRRMYFLELLFNASRDIHICVYAASRAQSLDAMRRDRHRSPTAAAAAEYRMARQSADTYEIWRSLVPPGAEPNARVRASHIASVLAADAPVHDEVGRWCSSSSRHGKRRRGMLGACRASLFHHRHDGTAPRATRRARRVSWRARISSRGATAYFETESPTARRARRVLSLPPLDWDPLAAEGGGAAGQHAPQRRRPLGRRRALREARPRHDP